MNRGLCRQSKRSSTRLACRCIQSLSGRGVGWCSLWQVQKAPLLTTSSLALMSAVCKFSAMAFGNSMLWTSVNSDQPFPIWSEALGCHHTCSHEGHETDFPRHHEWPQSSSLWAGQVAALDPPTQEAGSGHSCAWCLMTTGCIIDLLPVAYSAASLPPCDGGRGRVIAVSVCCHLLISIPFGSSVSTSKCPRVP